MKSKYKIETLKVVFFFLTFAMLFNKLELEINLIKGREGWNQEYVKKVMNNIQHIFAKFQLSTIYCSEIFHFKIRSLQQGNHGHSQG